MVEVQERIYPVTEELSQFLNSQLKSSGQVRSNLFQVDANQGFWKKALDYQVPEKLRVKPMDKAAQKVWQEETKKHSKTFLDKRFPIELREFLANKEEPIRERAKKLYEFMVEERKRLQSQEEDTQRDNTRPLSQGLVDLIHGMGYHDLSLQKGLKSKDGKERLSAFLKILSERDSFAMELGFEDHFAQVLKEFEIPFPTGVEEVSLVDTLQHLEDQMIQKAQSMDDVNSDNLISDNTTFQRTIRHLSLMESPFRSCLGGSDCASRTYLTKALDPNYHYFTLTDETGYSSGHITIVLGTANKGSQEVQVAFVDKVQNIDNKDIAILIEGVRRSVEEKGYLLALPKDLGGHNGISNEQDHS